MAAKSKKPVKPRVGGKKPAKNPSVQAGVVSQDYSVVDIHSVKPHPRNARKGNLKVIEESITENRFYGAVVVQRSTGHIIAGNHRWIAAKEKGLKKIPAIFVDVDDARALKILTVDNRANDLAGYDDEILASVLKEVARGQGGLIGTGFGDLDLARLLRQFEPAGTQVDAEPQIDRAEELRKEWKVETGQLWQLGEHRLLCGDSTKAEDVARVMGGKNADCVFTSPPYAVGIDYGETYKDTIENLRSMLGKLSVLWHDVIVAGGYAVINFDDILSGREIAGSDEPCEYPMAIEYFPIFRAAKWTLWSRRVWCKPSAACGSSRHCIGTNRAASNYEHVWTWKRAGKSIVDDQLAGDWPSQAGWFDTTHENKLGVGLNTHGAGMPPTVAARAVFWHSRSGAIVHEPFCGTGTTIIACEQLGRKCRAIEISPGYVAVALQRFKDATGKKPTLVSDVPGLPSGRGRVDSTPPLRAHPKRPKRI